MRTVLTVATVLVLTPLPSVAGPRIDLNQADAGGWPEYSSGDPPLDTDHDGIPDDWEKAHRLDPKDLADGSAYRPGGYTNLDYYLNERAAKRP